MEKNKLTVLEKWTMGAETNVLPDESHIIDKTARNMAKVGEIKGLGFHQALMYIRPQDADLFFTIEKHHHN